MNATVPGEQVATLVDLLKIQRYVFASNRLKDVIGGSALVERAASEATLTSLAPGAQVVFAAAGMAVLRFHKEQDNVRPAREFAARYSRWLVDNAPGLEVEIVHRPAHSGQWQQAVLEGLKLLDETKRARAGHAPVLGLSVTAECAETRLVAGWREQREDRWRPLASPVAAQRQAAAGSQWDWLLQKLPPNRVSEKVMPRFPEQLEHLRGEEDERSLIGIVHVDGNGVGAMLRRWLDGLDAALSDEDVVKRQGQVCEEIRKVFRAALKAVVDRVWTRVEEPRDDRFEVVAQVLGRSFGLRARGGTLDLPVRPVLVGGDDLTFICDGRIAVDLARSALEKIRDTKIQELGGAPLGASAGIAIARSHTPVVPTYGLAEALCGSAKAMLLERGHPEPSYGVDWYIGRQRPLESLVDLRDRQYSAPGGWRLTMRPYELGKSDEGYSLAWIDETVLGDAAGTGFLGKSWQVHRNKVKALAEIVRDGPDEVRQALAEWAITADVPALPGLSEDGFGTVNGVHATPLLDAAELLDIHYPLR